MFASEWSLGGKEGGEERQYFTRVKEMCPTEKDVGNLGGILFSDIFYD